MLDLKMSEQSDILLVLDLDETLIHATSRKLFLMEDFRIEKFFVYKRPHLDWFLNEVSKDFKLGWSRKLDGN